MGDLNNLSGQQGLDKLKQLVKDIDICMFCTNLGDVPFDTRPMSSQDVDDAGNIWFLSGADSIKNMQIEQDSDVQLIYSKPGSSEFLSVYGKADILKDKTTAEAIWTPIAKAWFNDGVDDPNLTIIRVRPVDIYYWDTKHNKVVSMIKIAAAAVSNKVMDDGVEGNLKL